MSSQGIDAYLAALKIRDRREKANSSLYEAYTRLADHAANLAALQASAEVASEATNTTVATPVKQGPKIPPPILGAAATNPAPPPLQRGDELTQLRLDLSAAQKSKSTLATRLEALESEHTTLKSTHESATAALIAARKEKAALERRLKDRDSELREKRELLERVQDELVGLEMQVNVAEAEKGRLNEENRQLVQRLVGEREVEVDRVNRESGWS